MGFKINSSINLEGEDKIFKKLDEFYADTESSAEDILDEGAEILKKDARARAAVSDKGRQYGKYKHPPGTMKDAIEVGRVRRTSGKIGIKVGIATNKYFTQEDKFYPRFVEFGHHVVNKKGQVVGEALAQPFMRPALVRNRAKIRALAITRLKKELGLE
jgi:HK97 gp10 family phage protein